MKRYSKIVKQFNKMRVKLEQLACQCDKEKEALVQRMVCLQEQKLEVEREGKCARTTAEKIDEILWG